MMSTQPLGYTLYASCGQRSIMRDINKSILRGTHSDRIRMRVDAVDDQFVEWPLELQVRHLYLLKVQPEPRYPARDARRRQQGSLGRRLVVIERLALRLRCRA